MKNALLSFLFLFLAIGLSAQSGRPDAQTLTDKLAEKYQLDPAQKVDMLAIQANLLNNLAEIEGLRKTDPSTYAEKMKAIKLGTDASVQRLLKNDQLMTFRQEMTSFRKQKSALYSQLKSEGATQGLIDYRICELEEAALLGK